MGYREHQEASAGRPVSCAVITVSDTRTVETDTSGAYIQQALQKHGHRVVHYEIIPDEPEIIRDRLERLTGQEEPQAILFTGGTGISKRDTTYDVVAAFLEKTLPGFGEIFRYLSYLEIGSGAIMSRATAGVARNTVIFSIPGSRNAVELAMNKLILNELSHLVWEVAR
ncbi:MAG: molybdenum cofactor biosynthesis protein B [Candidatus Poribacteria bacterium]|nr:MAG: molybdenum cofactor biosynthesis protein B [Candidatus Poribacteria bacterium]